MPPYDSISYDPPAPVVTAALHPAGKPASVTEIKLLIDTGADVTLLPREAIVRVGLTPLPDTRYELYAFDGTRVEADAVELDLLLLGQTFRGRYLLTDAPHGLLGRDVLNAIRLTFDGPELNWFEVKAGT